MFPISKQEKLLQNSNQEAIMETTGNQSESLNLRQKAEELLKKSLKTDLHLSEPDVLKLIHELEVHQIELELQNEELMLAKLQAGAACEKYAELFDFAPLGYFILSKDGEIIELNLTGSKMIAKERSRLKNSHFVFFVASASKPIFNLFLAKIFQTSVKETCEVTFTNNDSSPKCVSLTGIVARNGEQCLLTVSDITDQKVAEVDLQISEKKYRNLVENALIGIYSTTLDGKYIFANQAMCNMLEYESIDELLQSNVTSLYRNQKGRAEFIEKIKKSKQLFNFELELITQKGNTIDVIVSSFISGDVIIGMMMDNSDRKRAEDDLNKKIDELQRFHYLTVGRELTMIELKKEVNELFRKSGQEQKYTIVE